MTTPVPKPVQKKMNLSDVIDMVIVNAGMLLIAAFEVVKWLCVAFLWISLVWTLLMLAGVLDW